MKSGYPIPVLGIGTWRMTGKQCYESVRKALEIGYRHIDTAELYANEEEIGKAIRGFDRSELFITTKVWKTNYSRNEMIKACENSLKKLGTSYVDLYLLHWPNDNFSIEETMKNLAELADRGMVRSIGLSNFSAEETKEAMAVSSKPVCNNQIEFHPHLYQKDILELCEKEGIVLTAYCPVARGEVLTDETLMEISKKYNKTPAQVSLRWIVQHGAVVIPKSTKEDHLRENMDIFDWKLSQKDMKRIDEIKIFRRQVNPIFTNIPFFIVKAAAKIMRKNYSTIISNKKQNTLKIQPKQK